MAQDEIENAMADDSVAEPEIFTFGDESLSDVTLVVGEKEFRCHKMTLASRSSYFKAMFYSDFKEKNQDRVSIVADPQALLQLMELVYTGKFHNWRNILYCEEKALCGCSTTDTHFATCSDCMPVSTVWQKNIALFKLADQFDLLDYAVSTLENFFIRSSCRCGAETKCLRSAVKLLIAVVYGMATFKMRSTSTRSAVLAALEEIEKVDPVDRIFNAQDLAWLMKRD